MKKNRFSIIIPVYNVEKYLEDCLNSVYNQSYDNYEVIIINDGSTDNSSKVIEKYKKNKNTIIIKQKNKGLSTSRNIGIKHSTGEYLIFLDADDYLELDSLKILNNNIKNEDILRFQIIEVNENKDKLNKIKENGFKNLTGIKAFSKIVKYKYIDNACIYCIKRSYYLENNFNFKENYFHEDFGLIPMMLFKAKTVSSINNCLYNYRQRTTSIMHDIDSNKIKKKWVSNYPFLKLIHTYNYFVKLSIFSAKNILLNPSFLE